MPEERYFTVEEANEMLPRVREAVERLREARLVVLRSGERVRSTAVANGGGSEGSEYWQAIRTIRQEVERFSAEGIILRDTESGLLDFPAKREGRVVQLCWRLGEDEVAHWHEVDAGFTNRKRL